MTDSGAPPEFGLTSDRKELTRYARFQIVFIKLALGMLLVLGVIKLISYLVFGKMM